MKIWHCSYNWYGAYGAYQEYEYICIAETKEKAIEMASINATSQHHNAHIQDWTATEIPFEEGATFISSRSN